MTAITDEASAVVRPCVANKLPVLADEWCPYALGALAVNTFTWRRRHYTCLAQSSIGSPCQDKLRSLNGKLAATNASHETDDIREYSLEKVLGDEVKGSVGGKGQSLRPL